MLWTLTVELSFYLILPLLLALLRRSAAMGLVAFGFAVAASVLWSAQVTVAVEQAHPLLACTTFPYFWVFALGIIARLCWDVLHRLFEGTAAVWLVGYGALTWCLVQSGAAQPWLNYKFSIGAIEILRIAAMAAAVLSVAFTCGRAGGILRGVDLSYSLYLYHHLVMRIFVEFGTPRHWWLWPCVLAGSLACATMSWIMIERPFLALKSGAQRLGRATALGPLMRASAVRSPSERSPWARGGGTWI